MLFVNWLQRLFNGRRTSRTRKQDPVALGRRANLQVRRLEPRRVLNGLPLLPVDQLDAGAGIDGDMSEMSWDDLGGSTVDAGANGDDGQDDLFHIGRDGDEVFVELDGNEIFRSAFDDVDQLNVIGSGDNDRLTIDLAASEGLLDINFLAGEQASPTGDSVVISGAGDWDVSGAGASLTFSSDTGATSVTLDSVEHTEIVTDSLTYSGQHDFKGADVLIRADSIVVTSEAEIASNTGQVELNAGESGSVSFSGAIDVSSQSGIGGEARLLGDDVELGSGASVDASGEDGGGTILVGGDERGANPDVLNATTTRLESGVELTADGVTDGDGGRIVVWADDSTDVSATISARGGESSGDGGFIEVSGKNTWRFSNWATGVDVGAASGNSGTFLLDPNDISIIDSSGSPIGSSPANANTLTDQDIIDFLTANGSLIIETTGIGGNGDVTVDGAVNITWATANNLTVNADRHISIMGGATIAGTGTGATNLNAMADFTTAGTWNIDGTINVSAANATLNVVNGTLDGAGDLTITSAGLTQLQGQIGDATANMQRLASLTINGGGTIESEAGGLGGQASPNINTTGAQQYDNNLTLVAHSSFVTNGGNIIFNGTVDASGAGIDMAVVAGTGAVQLNNTLGSTTPVNQFQTQGGGQLQVNTTTLTADSNVFLRDTVVVNPSGDSTTVITSNGGELRFEGTSNLTLTSGDNLELVVGGTGLASDLNFAAGTVTGNGGTLTIRPANDMTPIEIGGSADTGNFDISTTSIGNLDEGFGEIIFGSGTQSGTIDVNDSVSFNDSVQLNAGAGQVTVSSGNTLTTAGTDAANITINSGGSASALTVDAAVTAGNGGNIEFVSGSTGAVSDIDLNASVAGTGTVTFRPSAVATAIQVGDTSNGGDLDIDTTSIGNLTDGFSEIIFGSGTQTGDVNVADGSTLSLADSVHLHSGGGAVTFADTLTTTGGSNITVTANDNLTIDETLTSAGNIDINGTGSVTVNDGGGGTGRLVAGGSGTSITVDGTGISLDNASDNNERITNSGTGTIAVTSTGGGNDIDINRFGIQGGTGAVSLSSAAAITTENNNNADIQTGGSVSITSISDTGASGSNRELDVQGATAFTFGGAGTKFIDGVNSALPTLSLDPSSGAWTLNFSNFANVSAFDVSSDGSDLTVTDITTSGTQGVDLTVSTGNVNVTNVDTANQAISITTQAAAAGNVVLGNNALNAGSSTVTIVSTGSVTESAAGDDDHITAASASITAEDGIGASGGEIELTNGGSAVGLTASLSDQGTGAVTGGIFVSSTGQLNVTGITNNGNTASAVSANSPLNINSDVSTAVDFTFTAGNSAGMNDHLTIAANVTHTGAMGSAKTLTFVAGDNIVHNSGTVSFTNTNVGDVINMTADNEGTGLGGISQAAGGVTAAQLRQVASDSISYTAGTNDVDSYAAAVADASETLSFTDSDDVTINTVGATTGVSANGGLITLTTTGTMTISQAVTNTGAGGITLTANGGTSDIAVNANVQTATGAIFATAGDEITNGGGDFITTTDGSGSLRLDAGNAIGAAGTEIDIDVSVVSGRLTSGTATGNIFLNQIDGFQDDLSVGAASALNGLLTTNNRNVDVVTQAASGTLTIGENIAVDGSGNISLDTSAGAMSDIAINADLQTATGLIRLDAGQSITTDNTGDIIATTDGSGSARLDADDAIGTSTNRIDIDVATLAAQLVGAAATGDIFLNQIASGNQTELAIATVNGLNGVTTTNNRSINVRTQDTGANLTLNQAVSANGSGNVTLTTDGTSASIVVSANVQTATGDIHLDSGNSIDGDGGVLINATNDSGTLRLDAANAIGTNLAVVAIDVATVAAQLDSAAATGGIFLDQIDGFQDDLTIGTASSLNGITSMNNGDVVVSNTDVNAPIRIAQGVTAHGSGDVMITANGAGSNIVVGANVQSTTGNLRLDAGGSIVNSGMTSGDLIVTTDGSGTLRLDAANAIGATGNAIDIDVAVVAAQLDSGTATGDIVLNQIDGNQDNLTVGTADSLNGITTLNNRNIEVVTQAASGTLSVDQLISANGAGDVTLRTAGASANIAINANVQTATGDLVADSDLGSITTDGTGDFIATSDGIGTLRLEADDAIGTSGSQIDIDVAVLAAQLTGAATTGDVFINQIDGVQDDLTVGTASSLAGITTANSNQDVTITTQAAPGGNLTVDNNITSAGSVDLNVAATFTVNANDRVIAGGSGTTLTVDAIGIDIGAGASVANGSITNTGTGTITLTSTGAGDINFANNSVAIADGLLTLNADGDDITVTTDAGTEISASGDITILASNVGPATGGLDVTGDGGGDRTLTLTMTATAGDADIDMSPDQFSSVVVNIPDVDADINIDLSGGDSIGIDGETTGGTANTLHLRSIDLSNNGESFTVNVSEDEGNVLVVGGTVVLGADMAINTPGNITIGDADATPDEAAFDATGGMFDLTLFADDDLDGAGRLIDGGDQIRMGSGDLLIEAGSGIGAAGAAIRTTGLNDFAANTTTSGGIFVTNSTSGDINITSLTDPVGGVLMNTGVVVTAGDGDIAITNSGGGITITEAVTTTGAGDVTLTASAAGADIAVNNDVQTSTGDLRLDAQDTITTDGTGDLIATTNGSGTLRLDAANSIGTLANQIDIDVATVAGQLDSATATGDIFLNQIDGVQDDLAVGAAGGLNGLASLNAADISVTTNGANGDITVSQNIAADGAGDVNLTTVGTTADIAVNADISTATGDLVLTATDAITSDSTGDLIATTDGSGTVRLDAGNAIGVAGGNRIEVDVAIVAAQQTSAGATGDIVIHQIDGVQDDVEIGTASGLAGITAMNAADVTFTSQAAAGTITVTDAVTTDGLGDVEINAVGANADVAINANVQTGSGVLRILGTNAITTDNTGTLIGTVGGSGSARLEGGNAIGTAGNQIDLDVATVAARLLLGAGRLVVALNQIDGDFLDRNRCPGFGFLGEIEANLRRIRRKGKHVQLHDGSPSSDASGVGALPAP